MRRITKLRTVTNEEHSHLLSLENREMLFYGFNGAFFLGGGKE